MTDDNKKEVVLLIFFFILVRSNDAHRENNNKKKKKYVKSIQISLYFNTSEEFLRNMFAVNKKVAAIQARTHANILFMYVQTSWFFFSASFFNAFNLSVTVGSLDCVCVCKICIFHVHKLVFALLLLHSMEMLILCMFVFAPSSPLIKSAKFFH